MIVNVLDVYFRRIDTIEIIPLIELIIYNELSFNHNIVVYIVGGIIINYTTLLSIANLVEENTRLMTYAKYYKSLEISGLHYVHFNTKSNSLAIIKFDQQTHHIATAYLILGKQVNKINTMRGKAQDIKKFLDYLYLWGLEDLKGDLLVILRGFVDYLKLLEPNPIFIKYAIEWSILTEVPLHKTASSLGKVITVDNHRLGNLQQSGWSHYPNSAINKIAGTVLDYLVFLKRRVVNYQMIDIDSLPFKSNKIQTILSGTLGSKNIFTFDLGSITQKKNENGKIKSLLLDSVPTPEQANKFEQAIEYNLLANANK
ncbi:MAG: hypothetical protein WD469_04775 [Paenibacillaceae bacterium]